MHSVPFEQRAQIIQIIGIAAFAIFVGIRYLMLALRVRTIDDGSAPARYGVAAAAFVIAALLGLRVLDPIIAYSILCFSLVAVYLADLLEDEHARRRRVAPLAPRPAAEPVPTVWIAIAALSTLTLVPYVFGGIEVAAALISAFSAVAIVAIAWRIASSPTQLIGEDCKEPAVEHLLDRASRARRTGLSCISAVGSIAVFVSWINATPPVLGGLGRVTDLDLFLLWGVLLLWVAWYVWRLYRQASAVSS